jgi:hypothetical protein
VQVTPETLTKINSVDLADSIIWANANLVPITLDSPSFSVPVEVSSTLDSSKVTIRAEGQGIVTFDTFASWRGGVPPSMSVVDNRGTGPVRLTFSTPINAFATYMQVNQRCCMHCTGIQRV